MAAASGRKKKKRRRVDFPISLPAASFYGDEPEKAQTVSSNGSFGRRDAWQQQLDAVRSAVLARRKFDAANDTELLRQKEEERSFSDLFWRQRDAFGWCDARSDTCATRVFSVEIAGSGTGARQFMGTESAEVFYDEVYCKIPPAERCHYELIREGARCRLYFDLEFDWGEGGSTTAGDVANAPVSVSDSPPDGDTFEGVSSTRPLPLSDSVPPQNPATVDEANAIEEEFVSLVLRELGRVTNVPEASLQREHVVSLDSCTPKKYSRHLIFTTPGYCFESVVSVGLFVRHVVAELSIQRAKYRVLSGESDDELSAQQHEMVAVDPADFLSVHPERLEQMFVRNADGAELFFADLGVYTRNRNFRLFMSSKRGRNAPLTSAPTNAFVFASDRDLFMASLVCPVGDASVIEIDAACHVGASAVSSAVRHLAPSGARAPQIRRSTDAVSETWQRLSAVLDSGVARAAPNAESRMRDGAVVEGFGSSPFSDVDAAVLALAQGRPGCGGRGKIRAWTHFREDGVLLLSLQDNRWCGNVQRQHKSNNVFYVCDMQRSVAVQKCYDPECRAVNYASAELPLVDTSHNPILDNPAFDDVDVDQAIASYQARKLEYPALDDIDVDQAVAVYQARKKVESKAAAFWQEG
jgi:DNA-directed primase/polymerase protein